MPYPAKPLKIQNQNSRPSPATGETPNRAAHGVPPDPLRRHPRRRRRRRPPRLPAAFASPPSSRKRSHGSAASTSQSGFLEAFSPSPPVQKRQLLAAGDPILLDDTPSPPKRWPSSAPELPVLVVDDDDDPSAPGGVVTVTPDSVLDRAAFSQTPEAAVPSSASLGTVVAETPGFSSPRSAGPPAARGLSSAAPAQNLYGKLSSPVAAFCFNHQECATSLD